MRTTMGIHSQLNNLKRIIIQKSIFDFKIKKRFSKTFVEIKRPQFEYEQEKISLQLTIATF